MKVTVDRLPKSVVAIDIAADPEEFEAAVNRTMRQVARDATIPGFRKGKAPRHIIERMIGREAIVAEAGRSIMDELYQKALEEQDLNPISEPKVDIYNEEPLAFKVLVEVFPKVELGDYKSVQVEPREVDVTEEEIEEELQALLKNHAEWIDVETPRQPKDGDQVIVDLEVFEGDEHFQPPATDAVFVIGESNLFDSLNEALKMMMPGTQSEITLAFEEDDETVRPSMRGKTLRYKLTLKQIKTRDMPELNDEFAQKVGDFETVADLRAAVAEDVLRQKALRARAEVFNEVVEKIAELSEVQVPDTLIQSELDDQVTQLRTRLAQQGIDFGEYLESNGQTEAELREEMSAAAEERVRNTLVLQEVAKAEGLEVTAEDIEAEIEKLVAGRPNPDQLRSLYRSDYFRGMLENEVHDRKLTELVINLATGGKGAITGPGAELLAADEAPPAAEEETKQDDAEETDGAEAAAAVAEAQEPEVEAEADVAASDDAGDDAAVDADDADAEAGTEAAEAEAAAEPEDAGDESGDDADASDASEDAE